LENSSPFLVAQAGYGPVCYPVIWSQSTVSEFTRSKIKIFV